MKRCPTCQQTYPDYGPDHCPNDGTHLINDAQQQQYYPGGPPPYGASGNPSQWQPPPPQGGYYQQPGQYPPPPPPYGNPYAPTAGGGGLSKAALFTGIAAAVTFVLGFTLVVIAIKSINLSLAQVGSIFMLLSLVAGIAAIVLGIITLAMAGKNPAMSKAQGIIGLVLGVIPIIFWIIGMANYSRYR